jgi:hypothetical protein
MEKEKNVITGENIGRTGSWVAQIGFELEGGKIKI